MLRWRTPKQVEREDGIDLRSEAIALMEQGLGITEVAQKYGVRVHTLSGYLFDERMRDRVSEAKRRAGVEGQHNHVAQLAVQRYGKPLPDLLREWSNEPTTTTSIMAERLACTTRHINRLLIKEGLGFTRGEARRRAVAAGLIDVRQINLRARKTQAKLAHVGSPAAQRVAWAVQSIFAVHAVPGWDIVVGASNWSIVAPAEINIPLVAIRRGRTHINRRSVTFAIEVSPDQQPPKIDRERVLIDNGWLPLRAVIPPNYTPVLEEIANKLVGVIRETLIALEEGSR